MTASVVALPVRRSVVVNVPIQDAFEVFTAEVGAWWPRTHHIGQTPMTGMVIEPRIGGRCYSTHEDGSQCDIGRVLAWQPPHHVTFSWQIKHDWKYEPNLEQSSEVDVHFQTVPGGATRVDLEHRFLDRHENGPEPMRTAIDSPNGWTGVLSQFVARANARVS